jgi:AcrR family transcriptional regulator
MTSTKKKILDTARQLYNERGLANVSQRQIAEQLGISPGNLTYHYKKKEDINEAIYYELVDVFNQLFQQNASEVGSIRFFVTFAAQLYDIMQQYRFFFVDIILLTRNNKNIANHYRELLILRQQQFQDIAQVLIQNGEMHAEEAPGTFQHVFNQLQIITDFYCSAQELNPFTKGENDKSNFLKLIQQLIYPYLTELGKSNLSELF